MILNLQRFTIVFFFVFNGFVTKGTWHFIQFPSMESKKTFVNDLCIDKILPFNLIFDDAPREYASYIGQEYPCNLWQHQRWITLTVIQPLAWFPCNCKITGWLTPWPGLITTWRCLWTDQLSIHFRLWLHQRSTVLAFPKASTIGIQAKEYYCIEHQPTHVSNPGRNMDLLISQSNITHWLRGLRDRNSLTKCCYY